jgi:hypothetical protein
MMIGHTLGVSQKERPEQAPLRRLAIRSAGLAVLSVCAVTAGLLVWDVIRRKHFASLDSFSEFTGWQLYLTVAAIGAVIVTVGATVVHIGRRRPMPPGIARNSQVFWALLAIAIGAIVGDVTDLGTKHVLNWASSHTAAAARSRAEDRAVRFQMLGDASHPPMPFALTAMTTPAFAAAPLLHADDLGTDWYLQGPPNGALATPEQSATDVGLRSSANIPIAQEKWNGRAWVQHVAIFEEARRFSSAADALTYLAKQVQGARIAVDLPRSTAPRIGRWRVDGLLAWRTFASTPSYGSDRIFLTVGTTALQVSVIPSFQTTQTPSPSFAPVSDRQIVTAAIRRAQHLSRG